MTQRKFHLAWFTNFTADEWRAPLSSAGGAPWDGEFFVDFAKTLERACFDYIMFEDTLAASEAYGASTEHYIKSAIQIPKHDPAPLAAVIGAKTNRIGIVATMSTLGYPPFLLARLSATIDHISRGRFGWNIVTSGEDHAAQNFGLDKLPAHDMRYEMADEFMECVNGLFNSWAPDSIVMDRKTGLYADASKVHEVNFKGKHFKSRGPLNTAPSPQGRPAYIQAGGSPRGRDFAAKHADCIISQVNGISGMKSFRDDIRARAAKFGRNPDDVKVMFLLAPIMAETEESAKALKARAETEQRFIDRALGLYSAITDIDLSKYDLDQPLPRLTTNGEASSLEKFAQFGSGKTLRQCVIEGGAGACIQSCGTPEQVADQMIDVMEQVGGDGFLITMPYYHTNRRYILEVTDGLVPVLQAKGAVRSEYKHPTLRENLKEF